MLHSHQHDGDAHSHGHDHDRAPGTALALGLEGGLGLLVSVGIDVGSSTSHLTISELSIGRPEGMAWRKPEILDRRIVYRSPIVFTPFLDEVTIDAHALEHFVIEAYKAGGIEPGDVHTGAVICTGEAARKRNAALIADRLAGLAGDFVCATAGHHFEAMLAAQGSGAVRFSRELDGPVVSLDVGGGTAKRTLLIEGRIVDTAAINVGARLIVTDEDDRVIRLERAGAVLARAAGIDLALGSRLDSAGKAAVAEVMAECLMAFVGLSPSPPAVAEELILTDPPIRADEPAWYVCSGGVSEYVYGWQSGVFGDFGGLLGSALRERLLKAIDAERLLEPAEGIRATVIGAGQYSVQISGETIYRAPEDVLPLHNVPVLTVHLDWQNINPATVAHAIRRASERAEDQDRCAFAFSGPPNFGYGAVEPLAEGIAVALGESHRDRPVIVAFEKNLANTVGRALAQRLPPNSKIVCVDELTLQDLSYLDVGEPVPGNSFVPVVVKSLVFA
jgi:ethanolamine utilization protein EutA